MKNKITRRAALGTVIAGLISGPFIMRAINKRKPKLDGQPLVQFRTKARSQLFQNWRDTYEALAIRETKHVSQESVLLKPDLSEKSSLKFTSIYTTVNGSISSPEECTADNLISFDMSNGEINISGSPLNTLVISVFDCNKKTITIDKEMSKRNGVVVGDTKIIFKNGYAQATTPVSAKWSYDPRKHSIISGISEKVTTEERVENKIKISISEEQNVLHLLDSNGNKISTVFDVGHILRESGSAKYISLLLFPYPSREISVNSVIKLPEDMTLLGFPENVMFEKMEAIGKYRTVKFVSEQTLPPKRYRELIEFKGDKWHKHGLITKDDINKALNRVVANTISHYLKMTCHIDIDTGLTIRQEILCREIENENRANTTMSLFQIS